jgi:hypothetical protein
MTGSWSRGVPQSSLARFWSIFFCSCWDYRNAIEWHQYDPTKWTIWTCKQLGLAYDLKQFRSWPAQHSHPTP